MRDRHIGVRNVERVHFALRDCEERGTVIDFHAELDLVDLRLRAPVVRVALEGQARSRLRRSQTNGPEPIGCVFHLSPRSVNALGEMIIAPPYATVALMKAG